MQQRSLRIGGSGFDPGTLAGLRARPYDGKIAGLYDMEETLGSGHFAVVKLARHCFTGEKVAVKVIDKSKLDEISKAHLFQEVRCMKLVQHPNVVRLYEVIDTATKLYLILELGDGGDLYDYIMRHETGLSEALAKNYFRQIVLAISYCHKLHVVHRDLKPENVVFFEKLGIVKLTDFGFSNKFCPGQKLETSCGSLAYSAPEILLGDSYDAPAVDIWSLGVILYMLVCGQPPFQEANDSETLTMIMDCKYVVPAHVSPECKDLISQMLVRNPDKRATLEQISKHPWLTMEKDEVQAPEYAPLVTRDQIPEDEHNYIMSKIVNGNMGTTKEEVLEFLDRNEYNNITATYYLLAERRLRTSRENAAKKQRPQSLAVPQNGTSNKNNISGLNPVLLSVPRTPGDVPQRSRKCSIVQEDEEEEDVIPTTGREELTVPLKRRGSKSEGRLNLALQERLSDSERRKPSDSTDTSLKSSPANTPLAKTKNEVKDRSMLSPVQSKIMKTMTPKIGVVPTTVITDSSTITIPISTTNVSLTCQTEPKYKTMPSPTRSFLTDISNTSSSNSLQLGELGEIFEEIAPQELPTKPSRQFVSRSQNRTTYEQRRSKFNKNRTASCSSSDASDDDSEKRKKRAHKLTTTAKPFQGRRDSHDDSSDSQEPGSSGGAGATGNQLGNTVTIQGSNTTTTGSQSSKGDSRTGGSSNGRQHGNSAQIIIGKRNKCSRRNGETRLRESQSLNRITEVQEDATGTHALVIATSIVGQGVATPKSKGITTRFLDSFKKTSFEKKIQQDDKNRDIESHSHISRKDSVKTDNKDSCKVLTDRSALKKMKLIGKYFQVHKKLGIPLGFFSSSNTKNRLYKAQSCGSLSRDKVNLNPDEALKCRQRAVSVIRTSAGIEDGDINQNDSLKVRRKSTVVQLNNVCNDLTDICAVHLGQASKCCSFC